MKKPASDHRYVSVLVKTSAKGLASYAAEQLLEENLELKHRYEPDARLAGLQATPAQRATTGRLVDLSLRQLPRDVSLRGDGRGRCELRGLSLMEHKTAKPMKNPPHPGAIVREAIVDGLGLTITDAANGLGVSRKQLSELVNERAGISPEMALRLEKGLGSTAEHWIRLQAAFDLARAREEATGLHVEKLEPA